MNYNPSSNILFLIPCSRYKKEGGERQYDENSAISSILTAKLREEFLKQRDDLRKLILTTDGMKDQGISLSTSNANEELKQGYDFGGDRRAEYYSAMKRYDGRFCKEFGEDRDKLVLSSHHLLFLSGLYGIVQLQESVQNYNCFVDNRIVDKWTKNNLLTDVLLEYIFHHSISRIFDFTGMDSYRRLIDWDTVRSNGIQVFHCYCKTGAGADSLIGFARLLRDKLLIMPEDELGKIISEKRIDNIFFSAYKNPPEGFPVEEKMLVPEPTKQPEKVENPIPPIPVSLESTYVQPSDRWTLKFDKHFFEGYRKYEHFAKEISAAIYGIWSAPIIPYGDTIKPLSKDLKGDWRYRFRDKFRLIYKPDQNRHEITLIELDNRDNIYEE